MRWLAPLLLLVAALLVLFAYLQYNWPGQWRRNPPLLSWHGSELAVVRGNGHGEGDSLLIAPITLNEMAVVSVPRVQIGAEDYLAVNLEIDGVGPGQGVLFQWYTEDRPNTLNTLPLHLFGGNHAFVPLAQDGRWRGRITGLGLALASPGTSPVRVRSIELQPFAAWRMMLREWFVMTPWQATSINFVGGNGLRWFPVLPFAFVTLVLAGLGYGALVRLSVVAWDRRVLWAMPLLLWLALDARWQLELWAKLGVTLREYAGKTWEDKHLAAEDGKLFAKMREMRTRIQAHPARVFLVADTEYTRARASYHLFPLNVANSPVLWNSGVFKRGDYLALLDKDDVAIEQTQRQLKAELLWRGENSALLRVR